MIEVMDHYFAIRPDDLIFNKSDREGMPAGTVLQHEHAAWTKGANGLWTSPGYRETEIHPNREGFTSLKSYPEGHTYVPETLVQWQWKLRDTTLAAARRHSVSGVPETLERLKLPVGEFPIGAGMRIMDRAFRDNLSNLPVGSVVSCGAITDPAFSLWRRDGSWTQFFGPRGSNMTTICTVVEVGGVERHRNWLDTTGDDESSSQIKAFKGKVWNEGVHAQSRYGWCGVFNQVLDLLGVNEQAGRAAAEDARSRHRVGAVVDAAEAGMMPLGTMFSFHDWGRDTINWFQRVNGSRNRAGTRRVLTARTGTWGVAEGGSHFANQMNLCGYVGDWMDVGTVDMGNIDSRVRQYQALPNGAQFRFAADGATSFMKISGARYRSNTTGRGEVRDLLAATPSALQVQITENWG